MAGDDARKRPHGIDETLGMVARIGEATGGEQGELGMDRVGKMGERGGERAGGAEIGKVDRRTSHLARGVVGAAEELDERHRQLDLGPRSHPIGATQPGGGPCGRYDHLGGRTGEHAGKEFAERGAGGVEAGGNADHLEAGQHLMAAMRAVSDEPPRARGVGVELLDMVVVLAGDRCGAAGIGFGHTCVGAELLDPADQHVARRPVAHADERIEGVHDTQPTPTGDAVAASRPIVRRAWPSRRLTVSRVTPR